MHFAAAAAALVQYQLALLASVVGDHVATDSYHVAVAKKEDRFLREDPSLQYLLPTAGVASSPSSAAHHHFVVCSSDLTAPKTVRKKINNAMDVLWAAEIYTYVSLFHSGIQLSNNGS